MSMDTADATVQSMLVETCLESRNVRQLRHSVSPPFRTRYQGTIPANGCPSGHTGFRGSTSMNSGSQHFGFFESSRRAKPDSFSEHFGPTMGATQEAKKQAAFGQTQS
jgi:hypothetical protein